MSMPVPKLDDKQFAELISEAEAQIPVYAREWTDHNIHDPGITFIELFAWLVEMQIYRLDRVSEKNRLKFLKLLGITLTPRHATAASTDAVFSFSDEYERGVFLPEGTQVAAGNAETGKSVVFETDREVCITPVKLEWIITQSWQEVRDNTDANGFDGHFYHAFGEDAKKGSMLYLGFDRQFPDKGVNIDLMVYLYEADLGPIRRHGDEEPDVIPSAEVRWEYLKNGGGKQEWVDLGIVGDETLAFTYSGAISFAAPEEMAGWRMPPFEGGEDERYWIRCRVVKAGYEIPPRIDAIQLNTVPVTEGETVEESLSGTGHPDQTHYLLHRPVLAGTLVLSILDKTWEEWARVGDLDASGPEDPHYLVEYDAGRISFGDGIRGLIPPDGTGNIKAAYRSGGGEDGDVKAGTIDQILDEGFGMLVVRNDQAASGGAREETLEEAIFRARKDLKERYRAVTSDDYEYIAKTTPGLRVKRAKSIPDTVDGSVTVVVVPESTSDKPVNPSDGFRETVCKHLDRHRLITTGIHVRGPEYVKVSVNATVKIKSGYESDTVRLGIEDALKRFIHPMKGGYDGCGWQFGRSVFRSEISGLIDGIDGVDCVYELNMADGGKYGYDVEKIVIPKEGLVYLGDCSIRIKGPDEECRVKGGLS